MKKILIIDDSTTYAYCVQKFLWHRGYQVETAASITEAKKIIEKEMPLFICSDLDLPDGSALELLDMIRGMNIQMPFLVMSCHEKDDWIEEAEQRGATLCLDKMKTKLVKDKLVEYAYCELSDKDHPSYHKLLYVHDDDANARVLRAAMLQKGFNLILVDTLREAKNRLIEDKEIELVLCDLELSDGTAMKLLHDIRRVTETFKSVKNPPMKLLPFFILTENNNLTLEYQYRYERMNDYFAAPVNIPELIRRILYFVEPLDVWEK